MSSSTTSQPLETSKLIAEWIVDPRPVTAAVRAAFGETRDKQGALLPDLVLLAVEYLKSDRFVFGERDWERFAGRVTTAPSLPPNIEEILHGPCPCFPGKQVRETHLLVYLPTALDGQPLTLKSLGELAKRYLPRSNTGYNLLYHEIVKQLGDTPLAKSSWALMTTDVLPGSRYRSYAEQQGLVTALAARTLAAYEVPRTLEAAICILTHYFKNQTRLFNVFPQPTYTRCQENVNGNPIYVGGFSTYGHDVHIFSEDHINVGIAGLRKFF